MEVSENPSLLRQSNDPVLIATGYKKNRFYLFTCREPDVRYVCMFVLTGDVCLSVCSGEYERDIFNEKPSKEEQLNATEVSGLCVPAKLFLKQCVTEYRIQMETLMWDNGK